MDIKTQEISLPILKEKDIRLFIKRLDEVHPYVCGNKWYKLKYNLKEAKKHRHNTLLTFGGAYSNHIASTAFLANNDGFKSIGLIRGEECFPLNPTLSSAVKNEMQLFYLSRADYKLKETTQFINKLRHQFGEFYLIPEGGTNDFAIRGAEEILVYNDSHDYVCCSVGTGGTIAGIINSSKHSQNIIGFPAIKGTVNLIKNIKHWTNKDNFKLINCYNYGGYAKVSKELINFINSFYLSQGIILDVIYTAKMMMGVLDLVSKDYFLKGSRILTIHTGGLQGNVGMSLRLGISLPY